MRHQYIKSILIVLLILILSEQSILFAGEHYDPEGNKIVEVLRREFPIPLDNAERPPKPGVYWQPWSYWKLFGREHSSEIIIYGVKDESLQGKILSRIDTLRVKRMKVTFYDDSRFEAHYDEKGNGGMQRLKTPILQQEILK